MCLIEKPKLITRPTCSIDAIHDVLVTEFIHDKIHDNIHDSIYAGFMTPFIHSNRPPPVRSHNVQSIFLSLDLKRAESSDFWVAV